MQESSFGKITEAVEQNQDWLKEKLKAVDTINYTSAGDWLAANRTEVEAKLGLIRAETSGLAYKHLRDVVENVFLGRPIVSSQTSAAEKISWGDANNSETDEADEVLSLQDKIALLRPLLRKHSSGGAACVPTSTAYLQILGARLHDPQSQNQRLEAALTRWRRDFQGEWIQGWRFFESVFGKETVPSGFAIENQLTGITGLDKIVSFFTKLEGTTEFGTQNLDVAALQLGKSENRLAVLTTDLGLTGKVIAVEPTNPFWSQKDVDKPPNIGDQYTCAGKHAVLVIECKADPDDPKNMVARFLTLVDPQTGTTFQLTVEDIYRACVKKLGLPITEEFKTLIGCGVCWVG